MLGESDDAAYRSYIKQIVLKHDAELGKKHGLAYAGGFHYIGPEQSLDEFIKSNAVPLTRR